MANNTIKGLTVEIGGDTTKLGKALADVEKKSRDLSGELGQINKLLKMDPDNADLLAQKQKVLAEAVETTKEKLEKLKEAEKQVQKQFERGEVSEEQVRALQREIIATEKKMKTYERAAEETAEAVEKLGRESEDAEDEIKDTKKGADKASDSLDDLADSADKAGDAGEGLGSKLGGLARGGLQLLTAGVTAAIGAMVASAEASREYRVEMGKLDTAFTTAGHSSGNAQKTYKALQGILGETDQAVEAANHLAKLTDNEKDLQKWTDICTGVYATFGSSLPVENLTEAANETAKVGTLTGGLADALNWAGVNEEDFQAKLDSCSDEQERQTLILETLTGLYSDAAEKYRETNAEVIRANEANEAWASSMADIGGTVEPLLTDIKLLGSSLLSDLMPGVKNVTEAFRGMLNGDEGAAADLGKALSDMAGQLLTKIAEMLPQAAEMAISLVTSLSSSIMGMAPQLLSTGVELVMTLIEGLASALPEIMAQGAQLLTRLGEGIGQNLPSLVSRALDALMNFATALYDNAPMLIEAGLGMLMNLAQGIVDSIPVLLEKVPEIISKLANTINDNGPTILTQGVQIIGKLIMGIIKAIPSLISNAPKIITALVDVWEAFNWVNLGRKAITFLKDGILKMVGSVKSAGTSIMNGATNALKALPSKLLTIGKNAMSGLASAIRNAIGTVKSGATSVLNGVVNTLKGLPSKMLGIGKDLVKGLWNGISDMAGWVIGKIQGFGESVLGGIKKFFGIKSPSRVFKNEVGKMLAVGLAEGVEENAKDPIKAVQQLSADMLGEAESLNGLTLERRLQHTFATPASVSAVESGMLEKLDKILEAVKQGRLIALDGDKLVGGTVGRTDAALGQRRVLAARGAV